MKRNLCFSPHERIEVRSKAEQRWSARRNARGAEAGFRCIRCGAWVSANPLFAGVINRNHCPYCLWSRHLDLSAPGDRLCACKAPMQPVGLTLKQSPKRYARSDSGELMLIHACVECGRVSINCIAADDLAERIFAVYEQSLERLEAVKRWISGQPIRLLGDADRWLVKARLFGLAD